MRYNKIILSVILVILGIGELDAQETTIASGGNANGSGGSASYSVGQVVYTSNSNTEGNITQGVQQPFEIFTIGLIEKTNSFEVLIFPNPTTSYLTLKVKNNTNLTYQLCDLSGKQIRYSKLNSTTTIVEMESLATATYILKVMENNQIIKTFKIIKN